MHRFPTRIPVQDSFSKFNMADLTIIISDFVQKSVLGGFRDIMHFLLLFRNPIGRTKHINIVAVLGIVGHEFVAGFP